MYSYLKVFGMNLIVFSVFILITSFAQAKTLDYFPKRSQGLILQLRNFICSENYLNSTMTLDDIEKGRQFIAYVQTQIQSKNLAYLQIKDLFTTHYLSSETGKHESILSEFCVCQGKSNALYEEMVKLSGDLNYINSQGMTPLMLLANSGYYNNVSCAEVLLRYGADPSYLNPVNWPGLGNYDALGYALVNHNLPVIELFLDYQKEHKNSLDLNTQELLRAFQGETFDSRRTGIHTDYLYRVANQSLNFSFVEYLLNKNPLMKKEYEQNIAFWYRQEAVKKAAGTYYYPPLWTYNILDLRKYAQQLSVQLKPYVIDKAKLKPIGKKVGFDAYQYTLNGEQVTLLLLHKKIKPLLGRLLGQKHLAEKGILVASKFIVPPTSLDKAKYIFNLSKDLPLISEPFLDSGQGLNPIGVEIEGLELYVEYIEGFPTTTSRRFGFIDNTMGNAIYSKSKKEAVIIDTGDDKNFIAPVGDLRKAYEAKKFNFSPHLQYVTIDLSKE